MTIVQDGKAALMEGGVDYSNGCLKEGNSNKDKWGFIAKRLYGE